MNVAGPAALLVAKLHKLGERQAVRSRLLDKDAHDVYRLLVATDSATVAATLNQLREHELSGGVTNDALVYLQQLFAAGPDAASRSVVGRASRSEFRLSA